MSFPEEWRNNTYNTTSKLYIDRRCQHLPLWPWSVLEEPWTSAGPGTGTGGAGTWGLQPSPGPVTYKHTYSLGLVVIGSDAAIVRQETIIGF